MVRALGEGSAVGEGDESPNPRFLQWVDRADRYAVPATVDRIYTDVYKGIYEIGQRKVAEGHVWLRRAIESAQQVSKIRLVPEQTFEQSIGTGQSAGSHGVAKLQKYNGDDG